MAVLSSEEVAGRRCRHRCQEYSSIPPPLEPSSREAPLLSNRDNAALLKLGRRYPCPAKDRDDWGLMLTRVKKATSRNPNPPPAQACSTGSKGLPAPPVPVPFLYPTFTAHSSSPC